MKGLVSHIQRMSIHDGPGIRTTIFLKGCNMKCQWCHNPETFNPKPELEWISDKCINCHECVPACKDDSLIIDNGQLVFNKSNCTNCLDCIKHCYPEALKKVGEEYSVDELMEVILQDQSFFRQSNGGVTISGGEPFLQVEFVDAIIRRCNASEIHTTIQTNLSIKWDSYKSTIVLSDLIMVDLKLFNNEQHKNWTGIGNKGVLKNLEMLDKTGIDYIVRTPIVPCLNDQLNSLLPIVTFLKTLNNFKSYQLLPFHPLAESKYKNLGIDNPLIGMKALNTIKLKQLQIQIDKALLQ